MAQSYEDMRCEFIDKKAQEFMENFQQFISMVKDTITNKELSRQVVDETVHQAIVVCSQTLPSVPASSEDLQPAEVTNEDSLPSGDIRDEFSELKREVSKLTKTLSQEKTKNKKLATEVQRMESAHLLSIFTMEKNLCSLRKFIKKNHEPPMAAEVNPKCKGTENKSCLPLQNEGPGAENVAEAAPVNQMVLPKLVEFPTPAVPPQTHLDVVLEPNTGFKVMELGEHAHIADILTCSTFLMLNKWEKSNSYQTAYDFDGKELWRLPRREGFYTGMKSLHEHITLVGPNNKSVLIYRKEAGEWKIQVLFEKDKCFIYGVSYMKSNPNAIAIATNYRILCVENGTVFTEFTTPQNARDIFSIDDDNFIIFDPSGFLKIDLHTRKSVRTVPENLKTIHSVASWIHGYFFALDITKKALYLYGRDMEKVQQMWSLGNQLRDGDELRCFCVSETKCFCVTNCGFVLHFDVKYEKKQH